MKKINKFYLLAFLLISDFIIYAQGPGDEGDGDGGLEGGDPQPAPINSKLILLAIIGLIFGIITIKKYRKSIS
ncbi:hypothetical protein [Flavobacterium capsici]|uniref:Signal peptidase n=1 Tax=Flavobacterium capsici TaxID=3075618 RepID=A0AA96J227_9FLAO|nr:MULTISPECIES: hypothetical protein [unclassified Flavobacterium]WNM19047.1 hypothetical protein RN608_13665 [Flavobacterium sp. PMR2A8]WNM23097.1 hypothetical protein RN605_06965 [Flavobacterium sp. PMTSA4]